MKKIILFPAFVFLFISCGGSESSSEENTDNVEESPFYHEDSKEINAAKELKKKLGKIHLSFNELALKEIEETVCSDGTGLNYSGSEDDLNVFLMSSYMLSNFDPENFGQHNFEMPEISLANGTPLSDFWWLNFHGDESVNFKLYKEYPTLEAVPKKHYSEEAEDSVSYEKTAQDPSVILKALENDILAIVAIVDYMPPTFNSFDDQDGGYITGYLLFADWATSSVNCMVPFQALNSEQIAFTVKEGDSKETEQEMGIKVMKRNLRENTLKQISDIVKKLAGNNGSVSVNDVGRFETYRK